VYAHNHVLLFGHEDILLQTRAKVLERAGFQVWSVDTLALATETIVVQQIDVWILCQTLSAAERWEALTLAETLRPETKLLVLEDAFARLPEDKTALTLETIATPANLIATVQWMTKSGDNVSAQAQALRKSS
jgi:hypothetical protein